MKFVYLCKNLNKNMTTKITFLRSLILLVTICVSSSLYALTFSSKPTDANCFGENTGSITVSVSESVGTCFYSLDQDFSRPQTSNIFTNRSAGEYTVYVKDDNGIYGPDFVTIGEPSKIEISPKITNAICPGSATGQITLTANGGTQPYTAYSLIGENLDYEATNNSGKFKDLLKGKYIASIKDYNGCIVSSQEAIEVNEPETLTVDPLTANPAAKVTCETDKTASVTFTVVGRTETIASNDTSRYYSVKLFDITNQQEIIAPNLKYTNKFHPVITQNRTEEHPALNEFGEQTFDEEGNPITNKVTYKDTLWDKGCHEPTKVIELEKYGYNETMKGFDCNDKITVSGLGAGAYAIRFFKGECEFAEEVTFTVGVTGKLPSVQINDIGSFCDESEYTLSPIITSNPAVTKYEWTLNDVVIGEEIDLTRTFTLEDNNKSLKLSTTNRCGTTTSNSVLVKVNPRPTAVISTNADFCKDQLTEVSIALTGTGPFTYTLPDNTEKVTNEVFIKESIIPFQDTEFTLIALKDQNCAAIIEKDINLVNINQPDILTVEPLTKKPAANVVCELDKTASVTFTVVGRKEVVAETDTTAYYSVKLFDITNQQEIIAPNLKYTNKFHPVITQNRVEKEPVLDENGNPTLDELGEIITKNVTYKDTLWDKGCFEPTKVTELEKYGYNETMKGFDCNDKISVSGLGAGAYAIRFFKGDCEFAEELTFTVGITGALPSVQINDIESFCDETEYTISPTITANPAITKYEWTLNDVVIGEELDLTRTFTLEENNKSLKLNATNRCGSTISNTVLVQVNPRPTAVLETSKNYLCKNQPTEVSITLKGESPFTYTLPDGTEKNTADVFIVEEIIPVKDTVFTLISLTDQNCISDISKDVNTVETKIYPEPEYDMTITVPEPMVSGRYVVVNGTEGFVDYSLFINDEKILAKGPNNLFWAKKFPYGISTNDFRMELTDKNGCIWQLEDTRIIESTTFPNIFTPNGDGVNDIFLADYDLKVYDRQGTLMYEGTSGWDGTHIGLPANAGVYLYTVLIPTENGDIEVIKSTLTLER